MKIFLGWSGDTSHKVALALRDWVPTVVQHVKPFVSSEDIAKGARWSTDLAKELETSKFGVICVTRENWSLPWINFEAGALSKEIEQAGVSPLFFDIKPSEISGPLVQFQYVVNEKEDIFKLIKDINEREKTEQRLEEAVLRKVFEKWWPELKEQFENIRKEISHHPARDAKPDPFVLLSELLEITRAMQREAGSLANKESAERDALISEVRQLFSRVDQHLTTIQLAVSSVRPSSLFQTVLTEPVPLSSGRYYGGGLINAETTGPQGPFYGGVPVEQRASSSTPPTPTVPTEERSSGKTATPSKQKDHSIP